jgi:hypothetical protein
VLNGGISKEPPQIFCSAKYNCVEVNLLPYGMNLIFKNEHSRIGKKAKL